MTHTPHTNPNTQNAEQPHATPRPFVLVRREIRPATGTDGTIRDPFTVELFGEPTAVPGLVIVPNVEITDDWRLVYGEGHTVLHAPTGRGLPAPWVIGGPDALRHLVEQVADLDWSSADHETYSDGGHVERWRAAVEAAQADEIEGEAFDPNATLPREPLALAAQLLRGWKLAADETDIIRDAANGQNSSPEIRAAAHATFRRVVDLYGVVWLLLVLHRVAPAAAKHAAARIVDAWDAGDSLYEWAGQWAAELGTGCEPTLYGIPNPDVAAALDAFVAPTAADDTDDSAAAEHTAGDR